MKYNLYFTDGGSLTGLEVLEIDGVIFKAKKPYGLAWYLIPIEQVKYITFSKLN